MRKVVAAMALAIVAALAPAPPAAAVEETLLWDTAWALPKRATPAAVEVYFDHLAAAGFSGTWMMLAPFYWQGGLAAENYDGEAMESFVSPNEGYLEHIDFILDEAAERGLQVGLAIAWAADYAGTRPGIEGLPTPAFDDWFDPDDSGNGQKAYDYGVLVGERWGGHAGLFSWMLGGDYWDGSTEGIMEETWVQMAAGLDAAGAAEPVSYGPGGFTSSWHLYAADPWLDLVAINHHCLAPEDLQSRLEALAAYGKDVLALEIRYEEETAPWCEPLKEIDAADIRADVEATVAAGAAGYVFGHAERWQWRAGALASLGSPGELAAIDVLDPSPPPPPLPVSDVVLVEPGGRWHLRVDGQPDWTFWYGVPGDTPLFGDWNGDGVATPGMFRPANGFAYLTNQLPSDGSVALADPGLTFYYGIPGDQVFVGDWDGDGRDSLGINRGGKLFLRNENSTGFADHEFWFGQAGDITFGGNPDGGADEGLFLYRRSTGTVFYTNSWPRTGVAQTDGAFTVGAIDGLTFGDWDGNGTETVGFTEAGRVGLKNSNDSAPPEVEYAWGGGGWMPVAGVWDES